MNSKRIVMTLLLLVLAVIPVVVYATDGETEPNGTPENATPIAYGDEIYAKISLAGDVDYYQFTGQAGDYVLFEDVDSCYLDDPALPQFFLYDSNMILLAEGERSQFALPADGTYFLKLEADPGVTGDYTLYLLLRNGDEPDNSRDLAHPITFGQTIVGEIDPASDLDYYRFSGRAGDVIDVTVSSGEPYGPEAPEIFIYGSDGSLVVRDGAIDYWPHIQYVLPKDDIYFMAISDDEYCYPYGYGGGFYELTLGRSQSLYVSASADRLGGNAAIKAGDIVTRDPATGQWMLVFDASDVGIMQNVNAFEFTSADRLLITLQKAQTINGLGTVKPTDILRFTPTRLGANTQGSFSFYLKGADVGLTTAGEKIDAIAWEVPYPAAGSRLLISTTGMGNVPKTGGGDLAFADEDLLIFDQTSTGQPVQGTWQLYLDGSTLSGLGSEDLGSVTTAPPINSLEGELVELVALPGTWRIDGVKGGAKDVLRLTSTWYEHWEGAEQAPLLTNKPIDALSLGPIWRP